MKILSLLLEVKNPPSEFSETVDRLQQLGAKYIKSGDYGSVYEYKGKAVKVTTDSIEIEHAKKLQKKPTKYLVPIHSVKRVSEEVSIIVMDLLEPAHTPPSKSFYDKVEEEATKYGLDITMLDIRPSNIMWCEKCNRHKLVDI